MLRLRSTPTRKEENWEEEFEKKFCTWDSKWAWAVNSGANPQEVKSFIRKNRADLLQRLEQEVGKLETIEASTTDGFKKVVLHIITNFKKDK